MTSKSQQNDLQEVFLKIGDETINSLGYLLNQTISEDDLLFKRIGPGFIVLVHDFKGKDIKGYASKIQNTVKNSEVFITEITISISVVSINEVIEELPNRDIVDILIYLGTSRINLSHRFTNNAFIDQYTVFDKITFGNVLVVEADQLTLNIISEYLEKNNFRTIWNQYT